VADIEDTDEVLPKLSPKLDIDKEKEFSNLMGSANDSRRVDNGVKISIGDELDDEHM